MEFQRHVILTGFMGSGKSTVGELVAQKFHVPFYDIDQEVVNSTGMTIPDLFSREGESSFRQHEVDALRDALNHERSSIISTGGGIITTEYGRQTLKQANAHVVWLEVDFETAKARVGEDPNRPLFQDVKKAHELFRARQCHYRRTARFVVDASKNTPEEIAERFDTYL
jgi:shikimate kinase